MNSGYRENRLEYEFEGKKHLLNDLSEKFKIPYTTFWKWLEIDKLTVVEAIVKHRRVKRRGIRKGENHGRLSV